MEPYAAIGALILFVLVVIVAQLLLAHGIHPKIHHGPTKDSPYESGMPIEGDTKRRLSVRFYVVAILFLLFDVEIIFMWPWAKVFHYAASSGRTIPVDGSIIVGKGFILLGMAIFFALLVLGLLYEWKRGAFKWD
ncbi:MAG: NADH-quinone oxidoreductase subunit A [Planctomycetes bacterium]|nr:NADH-quinone oxidoreductase subunit A [Planctomycetota bacterium]